LIFFHQQVFNREHPLRTRKHITTPANQSACKRINMLLRWMVRHDVQGVDFGLWKHINSSELICPLDIHVSRVAFRLGLLSNDKSNWTNAVTLTEQLKILSADDPVQFDFALFGLGAEERMR
jgi:Protein of unknown function (DUF2400).